MIFQIIIGIGLLSLLVLLRIAYKTLRLYIIYKRRYGNQVKILFYPLLGMAHYFNQSLEKNNDAFFFMKKLLRDNPKLKAVIILSGFMDMLIACDNDWIKFLTQDSKLFYKDDGFFCYDGMFGDALGFATGKTWTRQRYFLNSHFHLDAIKDRIPIFKEEAKNFCSELKKGDDFVQVNAFQKSSSMMGEIITKSMFGHSFKDIKCKNGTPISQEICQLISDGYVYRISSLYFILKTALIGCTKASYFLNSPPEKKLLARVFDVYNILEKNVDKVISELKGRKDLQSFKPTNFIENYVKEYLLQQDNLQNLTKDQIITKREIIQQYETFFFAGTDPTSQFMTMCLLELARNTQVKEKMIKEIKENVKSYDELNTSDFSKFIYMDAFIKEIRRLYPAQSFLMPRRTQNSYQREDLYIDKDMLSTFRLQQYSEEQELLQDSDKFIPERYLNQENVKKLNPFDQIGFSAGERNCIGQHFAMLEARYLLIYILSNFELDIKKNYTLKMYQFMMYQPVDMEFLLIKRK